MQDLLSVLVFPDKYVDGWPENDGPNGVLAPASFVLTEYFETDAHFVAYDAAIARRINVAALNSPGTAATANVRMILAVFDVDGPDHKCTNVWWSAEKAKIANLRAAHPGIFVARSPGGYRLVGALPEPILIMSVEDDVSWSSKYAAWVRYLRRRFDIVADEACSNWGRFYRAPRATRDGAQLDLDTIGDPDRLGVWAPTLVAADVASPSLPTVPAGAPTALITSDDVLVEYASKLALVGREVSPGKYAVKCPNAAAHTGGKDFDTSTILWRGGDLHCSHAHCRNVHRDALERVVVDHDPRYLRDSISRAKPATVAVTAAAQAWHIDPASRSDVTSDDLGEIAWGGWDAEPEPTNYVIDQIVPEGSIGMLVALGSSLKTWAALSMLVAVARGEPWLGRFPTTKGAALILDFESGMHTIRLRLHKLGAGTTTDLGALTYPKKAINDPELWIKLAEIAIARGVLLVVIDSLALGAPGVDENTTAAGAPLSYAARFTEATKAAVVFIHHARKDEKGDKRSSVRGNTTIYNSCDWAFTFEDVDRTDARRRMRMVCIKPFASEPAPVNIELSRDGKLSWFDDAPAVDPAVAVGSVHNANDVQTRLRLAVSTRGKVAGYRALSSIAGVPEKTTRQMVRLMIEAGDLVRDASTQHLFDGSRDVQRQRVREALNEAEAKQRHIASTADLARRAVATPAVVQGLLDEGEVVWSGGGSSVTASGDVVTFARHLMWRPS